MANTNLAIANENLSQAKSAKMPRIGVKVAILILEILKFTKVFMRAI